MEVSIFDKKLAKHLKDPSETVKAFGMQIAKRIHQRLQEFETAKNLEEIRSLPAANCHELKGKKTDFFLAVDISSNYRLIIKPTKEPPPLKEDGGLDWSKVTEILILKVEDYH